MIDPFPGKRKAVRKGERIYQSFLVREGPHMNAREVVALLRDADYEEVDDLIRACSGDTRTQVRHAVEVARRRHERQRHDRERVARMYDLMRELGGSGVIVGVDEVGRGAIAGPLSVAAVALPDEPIIWGINDSKQLTPIKRAELSVRIRQVAVAIGIAHIPPADIDRYGMGISLRQAMAKAIASCGIEADCVLIDGNPVHVHPRERTLVRGDARVACIAAASIIAKVTRDQLMVKLDARYPGYHLATCKGYGSADHIAAIQARGLTPIHRVTFCANFMENPSLF